MRINHLYKRSSFICDKLHGVMALVRWQHAHASLGTCYHVCGLCGLQGGPKK